MAETLQEPGEPQEPGLKEACGVFGVHLTAAGAPPVAHLTFDGLYALQHRGQESAGMAVSDGTAITVVKDMGLVTNVFDEQTLAPLVGHVAVGHTRYSTTGSSNWSNAQPVYRPVGGSGFALGHNGNLTNTEELAARSGTVPGTVASDSDLVAELLAAAMPEHVDLEGALLAVLPQLAGAFSFVAMDAEHLFGVRDPNGFRPLCLGRLDDGWVLASETPALDVIGAEFVREVEPGEMVVIDGTGCRSLRPFPHPVAPSLCLFEFVYFARPDSQLNGREVHGARRRMGELLAEQAPLPPFSHPAVIHLEGAHLEGAHREGFEGAPPECMVMGVPDSGLPAAEGYARRSGIPYGQGLVKNRYIGRTFIAPEQKQRARGVRRKLNPLKDNIAGKRLVVVDDSIVRGTTTRAMVGMLREAGALEVHLRVSSPPFRWPCYYGIDAGSSDELLAANLSVPEIEQYLGVDSLAYLTLDRLEQAVGVGVDGDGGGGFCNACLTGDYPVPVPVTLRKSVLEGTSTGAGERLVVAAGAC